jgi:ADP-ribose pyrophosphatase YjhB (NUDIX family)
VRLLGIFDRDFRGRLRWPAHVYKLYVQCEPLGGTPTPDGVETEAAGYFPLDALPPLSAKTPAEQLARALAVAADPAAAAAFD